eukprot:scaffold655_cov105-Isochrysis_galbana.AAC.6
MSRRAVAGANRKLHHLFHHVAIRMPAPACPWGALPTGLYNLARTISPLDLAARWQLHRRRARLDDVEHGAGLALDHDWRLVSVGALDESLEDLRRHRLIQG